MSKKSNSYFYGVEIVKITKHALVRFMQRMQINNPKTACKKMKECFYKSTLLELNRDYEKRNYNYGDGNVMFVCKNQTNDKGQRISIIITCLIGRKTQLKQHSNSIDDIDYKAIGWESHKDICLDNIFN